MSDDGPRLNDVHMVAARTSLSERGVRDLIAAGSLRSVRIGSRRLVPEAALIAYFESLDEAAALEQQNGTA